MSLLPPRPWKVALVDDVAEYRSRLAAEFCATSGWICVGEWSGPQDALENVATAGPHLLLLDVSFRGGVDGHEVVRELLKRVPNLLIVMLTIRDDRETIFRALRDGAVGYLLKSADWPEVREHAEDALKGGSPMTSSIARMVLAEFAKLSPASESPAILTPAEMAVLRRCSVGETEAQIAESLGKSKFTVRAQFRSILNKLGAATRAQAVAEAARRGWLLR